MLIGKAITRLEDLKYGDRLYFGEERPKFAGICLGYGYFVAAAPGHKSVQTYYLANKTLDRFRVAARR